MSEAHPLDHLVLPVASIGLARERLGKLGFTVAADAAHPFGTENACIFFADKTYLEPLGVASHRSLRGLDAGKAMSSRRAIAPFASAAARTGCRRSCFGTADAGPRSYRAFVRQTGSSGGEMLQFERPMKMPDGSETTAAFRLAFAADLRAPDFFLFTCQRINPLPSDRKALETHANGVTALPRSCCATDPKAFACFLRVRRPRRNRPGKTRSASASMPAMRGSACCRRMG
jgi:hypothetical protein